MVKRNHVLAVQTLGAWEVQGVIRAELLQTQTMFAQGVMDKLVQLIFFLLSMFLFLHFA